MNKGQLDHFERSLKCRHVNRLLQQVFLFTKIWSVVLFWALCDRSVTLTACQTVNNHNASRHVINSHQLQILTMQQNEKQALVIEMMKCNVRMCLLMKHPDINSMSNSC